MPESPQGKDAHAFLDRMRRSGLRKHQQQAWQRHDLDLKRYFAGFG